VVVRAIVRALLELPTFRFRQSVASTTWIRADISRRTPSTADARYRLCNHWLRLDDQRRSNCADVLQKRIHVGSLLFLLPRNYGTTDDEDGGQAIALKLAALEQQLIHANLAVSRCTAW
jgi:hypothetical protein